jgi:hypothetical protein
VLEQVLRAHQRPEEPLLRNLRPLYFFEEFLAREAARAKVCGFERCGNTAHERLEFGEQRLMFFARPFQCAFCD